MSHFVIIKYCTTFNLNCVNYNKKRTSLVELLTCKNQDIATVQCLLRRVEYDTTKILSDYSICLRLNMSKIWIEHVWIIYHTLGTIQTIFDGRFTKWNGRRQSDIGNFVESMHQWLKNKKQCQDVLVSVASNNIWHNQLDNSWNWQRNTWNKRFVGI